MTIAIGCDSQTCFLSIIVPAYNEEQRLPDSLNKIISFLNSTSYKWELIIVNNASSDRTLEIASAFARLDDRIRVLTELRKGKGYAVTSGMLNANGQYNVMCDADLSVPIEDVTLLIPPNSNGDVIIGSREIEGACRIGEPWYRHLYGRVFNLLVRTLLIPKIYDTQCGFKCFSKHARELIFPCLDNGGWSFDIDVLLLSMDLNIQPIEVPVTWTYKAGTKVNLFKDSVMMFTDVVNIYISRKIRHQKQ